MQKTLSNLHRWLGLGTAVFLFIAGLTGSIIAWDHELDGWLNPELFVVPDRGAPVLSGLELARRVEQSEPRLRVTWLPLHAKPGHTVTIFVDGRPDPSTGKPYELGYDQVAVDPSDGAIVGKRDYGASLDRRGIIPFLYRLHYTLHLPPVGGIPTGKWLMGLIAIVWFLDGFIALWISFPSLKVWRKSFAFRLRQGAHKATFDLHRSSGVWTWLLLTVLAFSAIALNLGREVVRPAVGAIATLTPSPFDNPRPKLTGEPSLTREQVLALARAEASTLGITAPPGGLAFNSARSYYFTLFAEPGNERAEWSLGHARLYFDANTGALIGKSLPGRGTPGDTFLQAQFPLHSGRILGLTGRILITILGLVIALLSATGVLLWARKRRARAVRAAATRGTPSVRPVALESSNAE